MMDSNYELQSKAGSTKTEPNHGSKVQPAINMAVYRRRWWVLMLFSLACMTQALVWNTWGPISQSLEEVFEWTDGVVALLPNLANISYFILVIPLSILIDSKGLRFSMIVCTLMQVICTAIRCFTLEPVIFTPLAYTSALIQGISGIMPFSAPPLVAAVWFPINERPTATAIGSFFNYFGVAISFIIGPQLVPGPVYASSFLGNSSECCIGINRTNTTEVLNLKELKSGISNLMYTHVGIAVVLLAAVLIYFPAKPPLPPSKSASIQRTNYKQAFKEIVKNGPLWLISMAGSLPLGVTGTWIAIIDIIVKAIGVSQVDAGWMGFWNTLIGCLSGIVIARFSSFLHRRRKLFLAILFTCASICTLWFSLLCDSVVTYSLPSLYASCVLIGIFINGSTPLFYEMGAEVSYPVGEGVTGGFFTLLFNVFGIVFLSLVSIPNMGITWLNWTVLGSLCLSIPMLLLFPEKYKRSDIDLEIASTK